MEIKLCKKSAFKKSLAYAWPLYLLAIAAPCIAFPYAYGTIHRPQGNELLSLFVSGTTKKEGLKDALYKNLKGTTLRQVDTITSSSEDSIYLEKLTVAGFNSCDLLIVPEQILSKVKFPTACLELSDELKSSYLSGISTSYYAVDGVDYGILYKDGASTYLDEYVSFTSGKQYVFINATSSNIGKFGGKSESDILAFEAIRLLFGVR